MSGRFRGPKWRLVGVVALAALVSDLLTKQWALKHLAGGETRPVLGDFLTLRLVHNPGAAFSLGSSFTWMFTLLSVVIVVAAVWYSTRVKSGWLAVMLGLVIGGALGNLVDRLTRPPGFGQGEVVDFISYGNFFVGNVADIWIVAAAGGVILWSLIEGRKEEQVEEGATK